MPTGQSGLVFTPMIPDKYFIIINIQILTLLQYAVKPHKAPKERLGYEIYNCVCVVVVKLNSFTLSILSIRVPQNIIRDKSFCR